MVFLDPNDIVPKNLSLPRWQRTWLRNHKAINFSGLIQETMNQVIEKQDLEYYNKFVKREIKRKETTQCALMHIKNSVI